MRTEIDPRLEAITEKVIGCAFEVSRGLGHGFLEAVYRNAQRSELEDAGLCVEVEKLFPVRYKDKIVGNYFADLVVNESVVVELKSAENISREHVAQVINYLRASGLPVGLLLNFGSPRVQVRRVLL
ncbi:MAG: GxxExxY protein [Magnetospirillum sp.]|nr:GxxExxY protein [Magnetospirillum sp.]